ncbi:MAG: alkaline phosphatase family protein [Phycisphaera sp.]|nr:alkaline phosphatase family protein [Phycisphaera sp.]
MPRPVCVLNVVALSPNLIGDATPRIRAFARSAGGVRTLTPPLPAVTCTAQSTMLTGLAPSGHGIVGNGWHDRALGEVQFWKQSNRLVGGEKVWETARRIAPSVTAANICWWYAMHASTDAMLTPRPVYKADGRKIPDCLTTPAALRDELQAKLGQFPLFRFWGPLAGIEATDWIALAAMHVLETSRPTLSFVYLPHLDYALQKVGPDHASIRQELREIDRVVGGLIDRCERLGVQPLIVSEYGIVPVRDAIWLNRALRDAGYLAVRIEDGREILDLEHSRAFAVADHQIAHVTVRDPSDAAAIERLLAKVEGVERTLSGEARRAAGLDHPRAGDIICVSAAERWFAYGWWMDDRKAPDYARTVDIHRKPGYDPCELFYDPKLLWPAGRAMSKLALRKLGFRTLLDVVPLDASLVRGSHGRATQAVGFDPVLIGDLPDPFLEQSLPMECVRDAILAASLGGDHGAAVNAELSAATRALVRGGR